MACIKWSQLLLLLDEMPSQQDISPQRSLSGNPKIDPPPWFSLPPEHTLRPLTHGPPPMYWLGTSRWWLGPLCMLHYRLNLFLSGPHTISNASVFVLFCCMFWLVFISCGVKDVWAFRLMFPTFHLFLGLGIAWAKAFTFLLSPCSFLSYVCGPLGCGSCHTTSLCLL